MLGEVFMCLLGIIHPPKIFFSQVSSMYRDTKFTGLLYVQIKEIKKESLVSKGHDVSKLVIRLKPKTLCQILCRFPLCCQDKL